MPPSPRPERLAFALGLAVSAFGCDASFRFDCHTCDPAPDAPPAPAVVRAPAALHVDARNATGAEDGSAARPFRAIQRALDEARASDLVLVAEGTYAENLLLRGKGLTLVGGYRGGDARAYAEGRAGDFARRTAGATRVRGAGDAPVLTVGGFTDDVTFDGVAFANGRGRSSDGRTEGGGILCENDAAPAQLILSHVLVEDNHATSPPPLGYDDRGGGVLAYGCSLVLADSEVRRNESARGAAVAVLGRSRTRILRSKITGNVGHGDHGGALYVVGGDVSIEENEIADNRIGLTRPSGTFGWGGGVYVGEDGTRAVLRQNLVRGNSAPTLGSGVFVDNGAAVLMIRDVVRGNACTQDGGAALYVDGDDEGGSRFYAYGIAVVGHPCAGVRGGDALFVEGESTARVTASIFHGNGARELGEEPLSNGAPAIVIDYSLLSRAAPGEGNLAGDPLFADLARGDLHLRSRRGRWEPVARTWVNDRDTSPAIDAGPPREVLAGAFTDGAFVGLVDSDLVLADAGVEPQPNGARVDLGPFGGTGEASRSERP